MPIIQHQHHRNENIIWINKALLVAFFTIPHFTEAMYIASMPNIVGAMHTTVNITQALSGVGFVGFSLGILMFGRLSDIFGRKPIMIVGLCLYSVFTGYIFLLHDINALFLCRLLQSFGASVGSCVGHAITRDLFKGRKLSRIYSLITCVMAFLPALSSTIGSFVAAIYGWEYNMLILEIFGITMLFLTILFVPETNKSTNAAMAIPYSKILAKIIRDKKVWCYVIIMSCTNGMLYGFFIEAPFIIMRRFQLYPIHYSLILLLMSSMTFSVTIFNVKLTRIIHAGVIMRYGAFVSLASNILLLIVVMLFDTSVNLIFLFLIILSRCIFVVAHGFTAPNCMRFVVEDYTEFSGTAGALTGFACNILVAVSNTAVAVFHRDVNLMNFSIQMVILSIIIIILIEVLRYLYNKEGKDIITSNAK